MLVKPTITTFAAPIARLTAFAVTVTTAVTLVLLLLLEQVKHLLGIQAAILLIDQTDLLADVRTLTEDRHCDDRTSRIKVFEHQVNNVVTSLIGKRMVLIVQLLPRSQVAIHLVRCLVCDKKR